MPDFDALVVGSGAGGGVVAWVLASRGWRVGLVEKGRNPYPSATGSLLGNDELRRRRSFGYHDPLIEPRSFRADEASDAARSDLQRLGTCVGGGTVFYDGDSPRVQRTDLALRSARGAVEGADVVDWPLDLEELVPFYDALEAAIGVQGQDGGDPFAEPRAPFPMPPGPPSRSGLLLSAAAERLGYHPHAMPMAIASIPWRGRPACVNCGFCGVGCPIGAKSSTAVTVIRDALATGRCTLLDQTCVSRVETSGRRAVAVHAIGPDGEPLRLTADHVVVATNAIETPRLLLASGITHPLLGRYLMFHVNFSAIGVFPEEVRAHRGRVITHALSDFTTADGAEAEVRGGYVELGGAIHPVDFAARLPWALHKPLATDGRYWRRIAAVSMIGEDMPVAANRVDLDPGLRDVYGRAVARVTYGRHPHDQAVVDTYLPKLREIAVEAGADEILERDDAASDAPDTKHLLGTARMGDDPASSVTDRWGRLRAFDNVWIADGSVFPTSTAFNPTLTQQALAWRTAAFLADPSDPNP